MYSDRLYQETIDYLYSLQKHGIKLALSNSVQILERLGNPHRKFKTVHVAGTNGKGSTSAFIASMLRASGLRVGLYTSPHLVSFTERIRINGDSIPEKRVVELAQRIRQACDDLNKNFNTTISPTFFEVTTALAFIYFAEEAVDLAVIEVGMGGRLDSTNVIVPLVSVVTNIDLEHTEYLGSTLEAIAAEKAGIIKPGVPVITGVTQPTVVDVIEHAAYTNGAPTSRLFKDFKPENAVSGFEQTFDYCGIKKSTYRGLRIHLIGRYQLENASLALATIEYLRDAGVAIDESAIRQGLEQASWEGRMERIEKRPDIYLDGAHNPASAKKLAATIQELKSDYHRMILVIGILCDKDYQKIARHLVPLADRVVVTKPHYSRALEVSFLAGEIQKLHAQVISAETITEAVAQARKEASPDDLILVTGSLYVVGEARALLTAGADKDGALARLKG